jgi:hypothetical protein
MVVEHSVVNLSDKVGHSNCVHFANRTKQVISDCAVNALIVASFRQSCANLRNAEFGFDSRPGCQVKVTPWVF